MVEGLEGSKDLIGDWVGKKCGNFNTRTNKCGGQGSDLSRVSI
jgi:urea transport system substrate-binding protein